MNLLDDGDECKACALIKGAICDAPNTTVHSLMLMEGFWRIASTSFDIRECRGDGRACPGGKAASCVTGQTGPQCRVCTEPKHFLEEGTGIGKTCSPMAVLPVVFVSVVGVIGLAIIVFYGLHWRPARFLNLRWGQPFQ